MAEIQPTKRNWRFQDLTGEVYGRLTVLRFSHTQKKRTMWLCRCECGAEITVSGNNMRRGKQVSCGCYRNENTPKYTTTHGMGRTPEYESWQHAKARCFNARSKDYERYGGRGITMCAEWVKSFEAFYLHLGPRPDGMSLDRIDNNKGYEPGNVRWATIVDQNNNRRPRRWRRKPKSYPV